MACINNLVTGTRSCSDPTSLWILWLEEKHPIYLLNIEGRISYNSRGLCSFSMAIQIHLNVNHGHAKEK